MTFLSELQALAEKWRHVKWTANTDDERGFIEGLGYCADELTELLGKVVVDEPTYCHDQDTHRLTCEDVWAYHKAMDEAGAPRERGGIVLSMYGRALFFRNDGIEKAKEEMRAALESALGVTK